MATLVSNSVEIQSAALHMDQYGGGRLPYVCLGANGVELQMWDLARSREVTVVDASGGYGTACLGANHPSLENMLKTGLQQGYVTDELYSSAREQMLSYLFGLEGLWADHFPFGRYHVSGRNSGSEGVELAIRLAAEARFNYRKIEKSSRYGEKDIVLAFEGAWHGWTSGLVPLLNRRHFRLGLVEDSLGPFGLNMQHIPFGNVDRLQSFFRANGRRILAILVEPIQGDAGIISPPRGYLSQLRQLADEHDAILIADEVLTFAKTGRYFAMVEDQVPIRTDITVIGKSLGFGIVSVSFVIARSDLRARTAGAICTSDLRPFTCSLVSKGMEYLQTNGLIASSSSRGKALKEKLEIDLIRRFPTVFREVRGCGFLIGLELTGMAAPLVEELRRELIESGVYVEVMAGAGRRTDQSRYIYPTLRIAPPLAISNKNLDTMARSLVIGTKKFVERY